MLHNIPTTGLVTPVVLITSSESRNLLRICSLRPHNEHRPVSNARLASARRYFVGDRVYDSKPSRTIALNAPRSVYDHVRALARPTYTSFQIHPRISPHPRAVAIGPWPDRCRALTAPTLVLGLAAASEQARSRVPWVMPTGRPRHIVSMPSMPGQTHRQRRE